MELVWLYSLCQGLVSASVTVASVRLCAAANGGAREADARQRARRGAATAVAPPPRSVACCLRLLLGWVGAVGGAAGVPVNALLDQRISQCLYTCITLVCCPLLVRHFTMFLVVLLTLDGHLRLHVERRYSSMMTRRRALCVVLLCWVASVLSSFGQFIGSDVLVAWRRGGTGQGSAGLELPDDWNTSLPQLTPSPPLKFPHELKVIGQYLPYGGFLSKFYMEDLRNFTYAEIHSGHWGVCAPDTILSPQFLVYVHGVTVFLLPWLCLLFVYLDVLCIKPRTTPFGHGDPPKHDPSRVRSLTLSLSLLALLCLPLHVIHALSLFAPRADVPAWARAVATVLFQLYGLVPPILFAHPERAEEEQPPLPRTVQRPPPASAPSRGKSVHKALCEAVQAAPWSSAKHSLKAKVCSEV